MVATIRDVAQMADVSVGTVSNVLNGKPGEYAPETRARVLDAVRRLSYHPNRVARSLVQRRSRTLGATFVNQGPSLAVNPFLISILDGMIVASQEEGYNVTLFSRLRYGEDVQQVSTFLDRRIDALCVVASDEDSELPALLVDTELPFIVVGVEEPHPRVSWIDVDNGAGTRLAMMRLFDAGHTEIAHLAGSIGQKAARTRAAVFAAEMAQRGLEVPDTWVDWCGFNEPGAYRAAMQILSLPRRPTAIFAANDQIALGVLAAARALGIPVPDELSLIGFDDIREAELVNPPLTTIKQPVHQIGYDAAKHLLAVLSGAVTEPLRKQVAPALIERATVGRPCCSKG